MKMLTPEHSGLVVLIQAVAVILFSISLCFFIHFMKEGKWIEAELAALASQRQQLQEVQENINMYRKMLETDKTLRTFAGEQIWEQVEFHWQAIPFPDLVARLESLDKQERIFVLESFATGIKRADEATVREERFHHLRGYFLCPYL